MISKVQSRLGVGQMAALRLPDEQESGLTVIRHNLLGNFLREVTERPEGVQAGTARLVGPHRERIVAEARRLLDDETEYERMARAVNPYGDGRAAERIAEALVQFDGRSR